MRFRLKMVGVSIGLLFLLGCSRLDKVKSMMTAEEFKKTIHQDVRSFDDVVVLFPKTVDDVKRYTNFALDSAQKEIDILLSHKKQDRTFDNTAGTLDNIHREIMVVDSIISIFEMVHPQKDMRDACHEASLTIQKYFVDAFHQKALFQAFKDYVEENGKKENLSAESKYYLEESMQDFKRDGLDLPQEQLDKVKQLRKEMAELKLNFETNIAQDKSSIVVEEKDLAGVGHDVLQGLAKDGQGRYILRCDNPTYIEVVEHCSCEQTRKKLFFAYNNRAYPENEKILIELIAKRQELSQLLGFRDFAALNIDDTMAKTPERVESFLLDLIKRSAKKSHDEIELLSKDLPEGAALDNNGQFDAWSLPYAKTYYKKKYLSIDEHEIAEYFPVEKAIEGVFDIYQSFLGLKFTIIKPSWAWHEDVRLIQVNDTRDGRLVGYLFVDLYPRDDKYTHACMGGFVPTIKKLATGQKTPAVGIIIANFPRSTKDKPALLKYEDVSTFFHEFGHAMHNMLGSTELASYSGTSVKSDFVETPSQMFEEWLYDKTVLQKVSSHYKSGQPLPDQLIDKMIKLKQFDSGSFVLRQAVLALYALNLHKAGANKKPGALWLELSKQFVTYVRNEPDAHYYASFGHIASDMYASKYYNYLWAKVFALDVFYAVKEKGILDVAAGRELTDKILGKGGSKDPDFLLKDYLGREPNSDAFLKDLGIM